LFVRNWEAMSKVYFGLEDFGFEGVDQDYLDFVLQCAVEVLGREDSDAGLMIASSKTMQHLNLRYRNRSGLADVLSFNYGEKKDDFPDLGEDENYLGDIYISYDRVIARARQHFVSPQQEFTHLFVHGLLHLMGFDHERAEEAAVMEKKEKEILKKVLG